jgi:hypothetical protein
MKRNAVPRLIVTSPAFEAKSRYARIRMAEEASKGMAAPSAAVESKDGALVCVAINVLENLGASYELLMHPDLGYRLRRLKQYPGTPEELTELRTALLQHLVEDLVGLPLPVVVQRLTQFLSLHELEEMTRPPAGQVNGRPYDPEKQN